MKSKRLKLEDSLTINSANVVKSTLLESLQKSDLIKLDLSGVNKIDISGIQLLLSFVKEISLLGKEIVFEGVFTPEFKDDLNNLIFSKQHIDTGEEFLLCIKGLI